MSQDTRGKNRWTLTLVLITIAAIALLLSLAGGLDLLPGNSTQNTINQIVPPPEAPPPDTPDAPSGPPDAPPSGPPSAPPD